MPLPQALEHPLVQALAAKGGAPLQGLVRLLGTRALGQTTLLGICPNSEAVTRAALAAAETAAAPLLLVATLNQVDSDGGYTGWTPQGLVNFVAKAAHEQRCQQPIFICLDHGGAWQKDVQVREQWSYAAALAEVQASMAACLDAGYALLHLDATLDVTLPTGTLLSVETLVARTVELLRFAESHRRAHGLPPVAYEIGTEALYGGLAEPARFAAFLSRFDAALTEEERRSCWPTFVVANIGKSLQSTHVDAAHAAALTAQVAPYKALLKGHDTDFVADPGVYPVAGIGGANVGPEFTNTEYEALQVLLKMEQQAGHSAGLGTALREAVVQSGRWRKGLPVAARDTAFDKLPAAQQAWLVRTGCRYIWQHPTVQEARAQLYAHVCDRVDPVAFVQQRIEATMLRYFRGFNLVGATERLHQALEKHTGQ